LVIVAYLLTRIQGQGSDSFAASAGASADNWTTLVSDDFSFKYPPELSASDREYAPKRHIWALERPSKSVTSCKFSIIEWSNQQEYRSLDEIAKEGISNMRVLSAPKQLALPGGNCVVFRTEGPSLECYHGEKWAKTHGFTCVNASSDAVCYDKAGNFFRAESALSSYMDEGKPDQAAVDDAALFDEILRTVEFKRRPSPPPPGPGPGPRPQDPPGKNPDK